MLYRQILAGSTSREALVRVIDNTTGLPVTSLTYTSTGIALSYRRTGAANTSITPATQTASGAYSSGGFVHIQDGYYRLDMPDAAIAAGAKHVQITGTFTGYTVIGMFVELVAYDNQDAVRMGLTAFPNVASGSAGALIVSGTGTAALSVTAGVAQANLAQILGTALTETAGLIAAGFKKFFNISTPTGTVNSLPDAVAGTKDGLVTASSTYFNTHVFTNEAVVSGGFQVPASGTPFSATITPVGQTAMVAAGTGKGQTPQVVTAWDNTLRQGLAPFAVALATDSVVVIVPTPPAASTTDVATAVRTNLDASNVDVNVDTVNDVPIIGAGTAGDKFRVA